MVYYGYIFNELFVFVGSDNWDILWYIIRDCFMFILYIILWEIIGGNIWLEG